MGVNGIQVERQTLSGADDLSDAPGRTDQYSERSET